MKHECILNSLQLHIVKLPSLVLLKHMYMCNSKVTSALCVLISKTLINIVKFTVIVTSFSLLKVSTTFSYSWT